MTSQGFMLRTLRIAANVRPPKTLVTAAFTLAAVASLRVGGESPIDPSTETVAPFTFVHEMVDAAQAFRARPDLTPIGVSHEPRFELDGISHRAVFIGLFHAHTARSDGSGEPYDAFEFARANSKVDFFSVTEHAESWLFAGAANWPDIGAAADAATDGSFVAIRGFEYSHPALGHFVVLGTDHYRGSFQDMSLDELYEWLAKPAQAGAIAIFAHPGLHLYRKSLEFDHFKPDLLGQRVISGMETLHWNLRDPLAPGYGGIFTHFDEALRLGWRLSSLASQDTHAGNFGTSGELRTGVIADKLTRASILAALRARHTYAMDDASLQLSFLVQREDGGFATMGDAIPWKDLGDSLVIDVRYVAAPLPVGERPGRIELVTERGIVADGAAPELTAVTNDLAAPAGVFRLKIPKSALGSPLHFAYVRLFRANGAKLLAITSPIFFD